MLAEVPGGLEHIIADMHAHPMGYDRRIGDKFLDLLNASGEKSPVRIMIGSIPQWCGGEAHYSTAIPAKGTMKAAFKLDSRQARDWLRLYNSPTNGPELAAKWDPSITGVNFADSVKLGKTRLSNPRGWRQAFRNPVAYIERRMLENPGMFPAIGEITGIKEMVTRQMGQWGWDVSSTKFGQLLAHANETGQIVLLHNDWGEHGFSATKRPSPAQQNYEHLPLLKYVFNRPQYENVQIVFAHTGIGRLVRPNNSSGTAGQQPQDPTKNHVIKDWRWDPETGTGRVVGEHTVPVTAPEHIHQLYELFEEVPNARVDISWNDVTQAYVDTMQPDPYWTASNPQRAQSIVDFFIHHQDRILFGSDTVKPVNEGQYNQALMTGAPLFAAIARRERELAAQNGTTVSAHNSALFKILRGNYEDAMRLAYRCSDRWTEAQLLAKSERLRAQGLLPVARKVLGNLTAMRERRAVLNGHRDAMLADARQGFDAWLNSLPQAWTSRVASNRNPGVFVAHSRSIPQSEPLPEKGSPTGRGTAGGANNDNFWLQSRCRRSFDSICNWSL
jgi:hypothetical protein